MKGKYIRLKTKEPSKKDEPKKLKIFNYGLALLKCVQAFLVVSAHNFKSGSTNKIVLFITKERGLHVPIFFILSFYFMHNNLLSLKPKIILNRLIRLLIPYGGWPIIIWIINHYWNKKYNSNFAVSFEELKLQLLWGHNFLAIYWFLWNLIAITILFTIIIFIFRKHSIFILQIVLILCYISQYSGYYYYKIMKKFTYRPAITIGSFFEGTPFAVTGFILAHYKIIDTLQNNKIKTLILSMIIYNFFDYYNIFIKTEGAFYPGFKRNILANCIIFIFSLFPSDKITNKYTAKFLQTITNYTGPVYYLHIPIRDYLSYYNNEIKNLTFRGVFIDYFACYCVGFLGTLIFGKTPVKYLFC